MNVDQLRAVAEVLNNLVEELEGYGPQFSGATKVVSDKKRSAEYELSAKENE